MKYCLTAAIVVAALVGGAGRVFIAGRSTTIEVESDLNRHSFFASYREE